MLRVDLQAVVKRLQIQKWRIKKWDDFQKKMERDKEGGMFPPSSATSGEPAFEFTQ